MENYTIPLEKAVDLTPVSSQLDTFTNAQALWSFVGGYGVYGGSTVAHCLVAAQKTIPSDYVAHSLYCSFVPPANPKQRIEYRVERTRDGKSFLTRTVHATQKAKVISAAIVNFVRAGTYSKSSDTDRAGRLEHGPKRPEGLTVPDEAEMDGKGIDGPFEMRWGEVLNRGSFPGSSRAWGLLALWTCLDLRWINRKVRRPGPHSDPILDAS
ncbi:acyl-CoA thioesterase [Aspergillus fumigatus]